MTRADDGDHVVEDQAVGDDRQPEGDTTIGQYDGDGRWMWCVGVRLLLGQDLLGGGDLAQLARVLVLGVLAVEELVDGVHRRDGVEVVLLRRAGGHPLEAAGVPRVERGVARACEVVRHDVDEEEQDADGEDERADGRRPGSRSSKPMAGRVTRYMRRGWPCRPRMCIGPNVRFMPMIISQKFHLPSRSLSIRPKIFGHQ